MRGHPARFAYRVSVLFLIALGLWSLDLLWVADVQAIPFTSTSSVDVFLVDQVGGGPGESVGDVKFGPPDEPLIDLSLSEVLTTNKTFFGVSSLTAFVNTDGGLFTQGVAQVDTLLSPVGISPTSLWSLTSPVCSTAAALWALWQPATSFFSAPPMDWTRSAWGSMNLGATMGPKPVISRLSFTPFCPLARKGTHFNRC